MARESCQDGGFVADGGNLYCSLDPGAIHRYEGESDGEFIEVQITNLQSVYPIRFKSGGRELVAITRVVEEREWVDGELAEVSLNYYARCPRTNNIYNFGEDVTLYEDGVIVGHDGSWLTGIDGAEPGLLIPSFFLLGARYSHGYAPGVSEDRAEHMEMGVKVITPAGGFDDCVTVVETTPLEPEEEDITVFAPGVGMIVDDSLELVEYIPAPRDIKASH